MDRTIAAPLSFAAGQHIQENLERSGVAPSPYLNRRATEKEMLSVICTGNPHLLDAYLRENFPLGSSVSIGTLSREALTQQRYLGVVIIALICRAVIDEGMPEHIAFSLSDSFIQHLDRMCHPEEILDFIPTVMGLYCQAIADYRMGNAGKAVRACCEYMMLKLHTGLTLQELSEACGLSPHYISDLFRKELGISALQYFHQMKLQYARHLILYSDWSMAKISAHLSYPSQSNFTQRFKSAYGCTPIQYRSQCL